MKPEYSTLTKITRCIAWGILPVVATACATTAIIDEAPATIELAPMEKPAIAENQRVHEIDILKDKEKYYDILQVSEGSMSGKSSAGCQWESMIEFISPANSWETCGDNPDWHSGKNIDFKKTGEIWPLSVGNTVTYTFTQINAHGESTGRKSRKCKVAGTANIDVAAGNLDTYKVVCKRTGNGWSNTRTYYFSPELGQTVKYVKRHSSDGIQSNTEFLRLEKI